MINAHYLKPSNGITLFSSRHPVFKVFGTLSPYAGCRNKCVFCPYGGAERIGVKTNFLHMLADELPEKRNLHLALGAACEPYCIEEKDLNLTKNTIQMAMTHEVPLQIFTKSDLILKDIKLIKEHSSSGFIAVNVSMPFIDEKLAFVFEPGVIPPQRRMDLVTELKKHEILAGFVLSPVIPYVNDSQEHLEAYFASAKKAGADYILASVLTIDNRNVMQRMKNVISENFPNILHRFQNLYENSQLPSVTYTKRVDDMLGVLSVKHGIALSLPIMDGSPSKSGIRQKMLK
ncbi:MAG: hypothetical protein JW803_04485 [Endomicrobiales bacterium]|nr:hypothetical protein [Endomicrobiales bacterium]